MEVPLDYFTDEEVAAKERALYETSAAGARRRRPRSRSPHDYLVRNAVGRSVLLTRDEDGVAHAFLNYCRHRGAEPAHGCGNERRFTCPYHAWVYDTKGQLVGMPLRDRYDDLDMSRYGLVELPSEERHGFVWVVLRRDHPIDVAAHLGELDTEIGSLGCDRMHYYSSIAEAPLAANWKSVAEGLLEGLHVPYVHADTFNLNPQAVNVDLAFSDVDRSARALGPADVRQGRSRAAARDARGRVAPRREHRLHLADLARPAARQRALRDHLRRPVARPSPSTRRLPLRLAEPGRRGARRHARPRRRWRRERRRPSARTSSCGKAAAAGLARGAHGYELIGRNEKGVQLFHETLARQVGYAGLRYV